MSDRRLLMVLVATLIAGAAAGSAFLIWFSESLGGLQVHETRGYDITAGRILVVVAAGGVVSALAGGVTVEFWPWATSFVLGLAGVGAVITGGATYTPDDPERVWTATGGYWVALAVTIAWPAWGAIATYLVLRRPDAFGEIRWLRVLFDWLEGDSNPPATRLTIAFVAASASCVFTLVGALGPWKTTGVASISGVDNTGDGMIVLGAAFLAALALLSYLGFGSRRALLAVLGFAVAAAATSIYYLDSIGAETDVATGWGINLDAAASVALAVSGAALLFGPGRSLITRSLPPPASPPPLPASPTPTTAAPPSSLLGAPAPPPD